ncbi:MAG TPA: hypothetical protein PKI19_00975 [Elusimicrobiales bacterium]|nr:hypothetical protein [Elusimicrobiales bacterium]
MTPEIYLETLKKACGGNLQSFVLYGSTAAGDAIAGKSDCNVMLLLKDASLSELRVIAAASRDWLKKGNPPPLIFTPEQFGSSADTFPIELADMKEFHVVLYGDDPLPALNINPADLRLAVERELKGKLIQLHGAYLALAGSSRPLPGLMTGSLSQVLVLCRAALRLRAASVPGSKLACAAQLREHVEFDAEVFAVVHALRSGKAADGDEEALFGRYLGAIEKLSAAIDGWGN